jgi:hypothetical protein
MVYVSQLKRVLEYTCIVQQLNIKQGKFEYIKGIIRSRKSKKTTQWSKEKGQKDKQGSSKSPVVA